MGCLKDAVEEEEDGKHKSSFLVLDKAHERKSTACTDSYRRMHFLLVTALNLSSALTL